MPKRKSSPCGPSPFNIAGHPWELIEPMLRAAETERPSCRLERRDPFDAYFSAVRNVRQCLDSCGTPCLTWEAYGVAMIGGPYVSQKVAKQGTCPACGALIATNYGNVCLACRLKRKRQTNREASRRYRLRHGIKQGFPVQLCERCGSVFEAKRSTARYCSTACRVAAHRARSADSSDAD
jgi:hypothetical protein